MLQKKINPKKIRKDYLDSVERELQNDGVILFEPEKNLKISKEYLSLPKHITDISSRDLGEYLNAFTQQKLYLRTLLGRICVYLEESRQKYYKLSGSHYQTMTKSKMSETAKERELVTLMCETEEYQEFSKTIERKRMIELSIANIEDVVFLLSREVSRRTGDFNDEKRLANL